MYTPKDRSKQPLQRRRESLMGSLLRALWLYRVFVVSSIRNEFVVRFSRSKLGALWMIIHPLTQVAIYALILSNVLAAKLPGIDNKYAYAIYLMAGTLAWNLFSEIVGRCLNLFIEQGNLLKKMQFPRITLPTIVVGSCTLNNVLLFVAMLGVFALLGHFPGVTVIWLLPLTFVVIALGVGFGLTLGVLNVFVRDVGQVVPILLQILFWFTPIVYPANVVPIDLQKFISYNPMFAIVTAYHNVLVYDTSPQFAQVIPIGVIAIVFLLFGLFVFRRAAPEMVDAL
jgi:lipopolysaccharide transport system permease protein